MGANFETYSPPCSRKKIGRLENFHWVKKPKKIPVVFTRDEAKKVLLHLRGKYWLVSSLLFGSGLRLMEALILHVKDLDFTDRQLTIHKGSWRAISSGDFESPTQPTTNRPIIIEIIVLCFICVTSTT